MGRERSAFHPGPEFFSPTKAEYICADQRLIHFSLATRRRTIHSGWPVEDQCPGGAPALGVDRQVWTGQRETQRCAVGVAGIRAGVSSVEVAAESEREPEPSAANNRQKAQTPRSGGTACGFTAGGESVRLRTGTVHLPSLRPADSSHRL
jgi:hypothetical protein